MARKAHSSKTRNVEMFRTAQQNLKNLQKFGSKRNFHQEAISLCPIRLKSNTQIESFLFPSSSLASLKFINLSQKSLHDQIKTYSSQLVGMDEQQRNQHHHDPSCIFCKIVLGQIPSFKVAETSTVLAFFDINPLSFGHTLIIPKYHGAKLHEIPDNYLSDILKVSKNIAIELGLKDYNLLQNNGRIAHQEIDHVHFHVIPKPTASDSEGLVIGWPCQKPDMESLVAKLSSWRMIVYVSEFATSSPSVDLRVKNAKLPAANVNETTR
ncbi:hypothetical protein O181_009485 [Austropuccinia psidii MF-1]|uniref:HIT domain-containing protein n=1 Tax=Austropuccinia psidii MF-1 TaxID=1389203 RepID=A0A9Q3BS18_9BASI|nr:hypothetical protein [Austropuccinia psidii MF-1]